MVTMSKGVHVNHNSFNYDYFHFQVLILIDYKTNQSDYVSTKINTSYL